MSKRQICCAYCVIACLAAVPVRAGIMIHFDQDVYTVNLGKTVQLEVVLDANDLIPGDQTLPEGLFSAAIQIGFNPQIVGVPAGLDPVELPDGLNSNGIGGPPVIDLQQPGLARISGLADLIQVDVYRGQGGRMWLARLEVTGLQEGQTPLDLGLWVSRPNAKVLLNGLGKILDDEPGLSFGTATLNVVVPEPASGVLFALGCGLWPSRLRRRPSHIVLEN